MCSGQIRRMRRFLTPEVIHGSESIRVLGLVLIPVVKIRCRCIIGKARPIRTLDPEIVEREAEECQPQLVERGLYLWHGESMFHVVE